MMKRILRTLKELFTKNKKLKLVYLIIIFALCYLPSMCNNVKITTPSQDANRLYQMAQSVETEEELRSLEILCNEMEIAYRHSYNGAMAIKFRLMTQFVVDEGAARRDAFRKMEDAEDRAEVAFDALMSDLDAAWQIEIPSENEALKEYNKLAQACVDTHMAMRAKLIELNKASIETIQNSYKQEYLDRENVINKDIATIEDRLAECNADLKHYNIAYRLKYGKEFSNSILLNKYINAFDGRYTRVNAGEVYGDVEYVGELLSLAESAEDIELIKSKIVNVIAEAYRADFKKEGSVDSEDFGYDGMFLEKVSILVEDANIAVYEIEQFKQLPNQIQSFVDKYDAQWGITTEE